MTYGKLAMTLASFGTAGYFALLNLIGYLFWAVLRHPSGLDAQERRKAIVAALLPLLFFIVAYIPPTMLPKIRDIWRQGGLEADPTNVSWLLAASPRVHDVPSCSGSAAGGGAGSGRAYASAG